MCSSRELHLPFYRQPGQLAKPRRRCYNDKKTEGRDGMIRLAAAADLDAVCAIYREILAREKTGMRYTQWIEGLYPTRETAERGLREGTLYVLEEGGAVAASVMTPPVSVLFSVPLPMSPIHAPVVTLPSTL